MVSLQKIWIVAAILGAFAAIACSEKDPEEITEIETIIGPEGGLALGPDNVSMKIPADALTEKVTFVIKKTRLDPDTTFKKASPVYEFTPHGTVFKKEATVTIPYKSDGVESKEDSLRLHWADSEDGPWEVLEGATDKTKKTASGKTTHLSFGVVGLPDETADTETTSDTVDTESDTGDTTTETETETETVTQDTDTDTGFYLDSDSDTDTATPAGCQNWLQSPLPAGVEQLYGVASTGDTSVVAAGINANKEGVIAYLFGGKWTVVTHPLPLRAVWATGTGEYVVVGDAGTVLHGTPENGVFTQITSSATKPQKNLHSVFGGTSQTGSPQYIVGDEVGNVWTYDVPTTTWQFQLLSVGVVTGIWGMSVDNYWATVNTSECPSTSVYSHWQQSSGEWFSDYMNYGCPAANAIWGYGDALVLSVGDYQSAWSSNQGSVWDPATSHGLTFTDNLNGISGQNDMSIWAVGGNTITWFGGEVWELCPSAVNADIRAITATTTGAWAVGKVLLRQN